MRKAPIPGSLGLSRTELPQVLNREAFVTWLRSRGTQVSYVSLPFSKLTPSQAEMDADKVDNMSGEGIVFLLGKPLIVSRDHVVLDGHHRWLAALSLDSDIAGPCYQVDSDFKELLGISMESPYTKIVSLGESLRALTGELRSLGG